jgi:hypothetical protein
VRGPRTSIRGHARERPVVREPPGGFPATKGGLEIMNSHLTHGAIAAAVAAFVAAAAINLSPVRQVMHSINASKHAWRDLTDAQKADLGRRFAAIPGLKLDINCGDGACTDLAQDIDDAAERAGVESILDHPITPLGYGIGIAADAGDDRGQKVAAALAAAGELKSTVKTDRTFGYVAIFIGKAPQK